MPLPPTSNADQRVIEDFGREWQLFDQSEMGEEQATHAFAEYFSVFPWDEVSTHAVGFDLGCGSGRWARMVAPRVGHLHCIEPSAAIEVAKSALAGASNVSFHQNAADSIPLADESMDFGYCLGVLHHVPDTQAGLAECVRRLKPGAPFLLYLYYNFDNRPAWFRAIWKVSDVFRGVISRLPFLLKRMLASLIAIFAYWPLARLARMLAKGGKDVDSLPLSYYRERSLYVMRTDALDRFGTRLEKRFSRKQIEAMMQQAGLEQIIFREGAPYWCAVGRRRRA